MSSRARILPDLTAEDRAFEAQLNELCGVLNFRFLQSRHPDGVTLYDLARCFKWPYPLVFKLVLAAEQLDRIKIRRTQCGSIRFVWLVGYRPPLTVPERHILKCAQKDLDNGPDEIWALGAASDLQIGVQAVYRALDFLVFAELLTRTGKIYALTDLGRMEGVSA